MYFFIYLKFLNLQSSKITRNDGCFAWGVLAIIHLHTSRFSYNTHNIVPSQNFIHPHLQTIFLNHLLFSTFCTVLVTSTKHLCNIRRHFSSTICSLMFKSSQFNSNSINSFQSVTSCDTAHMLIFCSSLSTLSSGG